MHNTTKPFFTKKNMFENYIIFLNYAKILFIIINGLYCKWRLMQVFVDPVTNVEYELYLELIMLYWHQAHVKKAVYGLITFNYLVLSTM